jgi:hypothetical protein
VRGHVQNPVGLSEFSTRNFVCFLVENKNAQAQRFLCESNCAVGAFQRCSPRQLLKSPRFTFVALIV